MAHSWVESFATEAESFAAFALVFPAASTLLVDTYDTEHGVVHAAAIEPPVQAVRLDSGDLLDLARKARRYLDSHGRTDVKIFATGDLDESSIARLVAAGAPIDGLGVGTELATSRDAPALSIVYKLVALDGAGRIKLSPGKKTYPFAKQIYRARDPSGRFVADRVTRWDEPAEGEPLLVPLVQGGALVSTLPALDEIRARCTRQVAALPEELKDLDRVGSYPVSYSTLLEDEVRRLAAQA
jgi:nicotinate phosphoribosyltransferase